MTEVPEHLLRRSKERRDALGLGGEAGEGAAAPVAPAAPAAGSPAVETPAAAAATPAVAEPAATAAAVPAVTTPELPTYALPASTRRIPGWMYPVLVALPFWAVVYFGAFGTRQAAKVDPLVLGQQVYNSAGCAGCHGATGGGGVGPKLAGGEVALTFPNVADHVAWVKSGSAAVKGQGYGDPKRAGGQHIAKTGGMPAFAGTLTEEQIQAVVQYEREKL